MQIKNSIVGRIAAVAVAAAMSAALLAGAPDDASGGGTRLVQVPGTSVTLELWEGLDASGAFSPHYAVSFDGRTFSEPQATSYDIKLRYGQFDPLGVSALPEVPASLASAEDTSLYIVQYLTQPLEVFRDALRDLGTDVQFFLANHCHIVKMDPNVVGEVENLPFVRWVGDFHPAYRLDPLVFDSIMNGESGWQDYSIMVFGRGMVPQNVVADQLQALGGTVMSTAPDGFRMTVTATPDMIAQIVRMDEVHFIDPWGPGELDMDIVREIGGANYVEGETGISGEGVRGEIFDTEVNASHVEWLYPPIIHCAGGSSSHGSSCYGINFAQGIDPQARGLCPDGQGIFCYYEVSDQFGGPTTRLQLNTEATDPAGPYRSCYQTSSVGSPRTTAYTSISADTDNYLFQVDYLSFQSQSNAGDPMSRPQAWAKNICSVGGITHENTLTRADDHHTGGSTGPAADGRIKPDLAHFYDDIFTTSASGYTQFGGTSGATPCTSGHGGLTMQMWHEGVFPGFGGGPSVFDDRPKSTTTKALLINNAYRYVWYGTSPPNPDINREKQGWGMADIGRMYDQRYKMLIINETEVLANLGSAYYTVVVTDDPSFRATMVYLDPPGSPSSSQARINDLSLKVTDPNGVVYWGNNGLHTSNVSSPGGVPNDVDTTENVFVDNPEPGTWIVEVIAHEIVEDAHLETPQMDADFALVVSGVVEELPPLIMRLPTGVPNLVPPGTPVDIDVEILDGDETVVPGTEMMHYRMDAADPFTTVPLVNMGGGAYVGTVPAATCDDLPEFYFSAEGDGGSVVTAPLNAPASLYSYNIGEYITITVFTEDFEAGLPAGWTTTGLWHVTGDCLVSPPCNGVQWAYYGQDGVCHYDTGAENSGSMTSAPITLPTLPVGGDLDLNFCYNLETEALGGYDVAELYVDGQLVFTGSESAAWTTRTVNLNSFAGQTVTLEWFFDTVDGLYNEYHGWQVDLVEIISTDFQCIEVCPADVNGDNVVDVLDLLAVLAAWGATGGPEDVNGDGIVNVLDLLEVLAAWGPCP